MENLPSRFELLLKALDENEEIAYEKLFELREKVINFLRFNDGGRFGADYEVMADQALDGVDEYFRNGKEVRSIRNLTFTIAKNKWTKFYKEQKRLTVLNDDGTEKEFVIDFEKTFEDKELEKIAYECKKKCLNEVCSKEDRYLIIQFCDKDINNELLAEEIETNYNNLKKKIFEIRKKLNKCKENCMKNRK